MGGQGREEREGGGGGREEGMEDGTRGSRGGETGQGTPVGVGTNYSLISSC